MDNLNTTVTTSKNFRTEDVTHVPRKQLENMRESYKEIRGFKPVSMEAIDRLVNEFEAEGAINTYVSNHIYVSRKIIMPQRATKRSAGYDVFSHSNIVIPAKGTVLIWTNVKAYMQEREVLIADVRSSIGIKQNIMLANTLGIIDCDYYNNSSNEGNIGIALRNLSNEMDVKIKEGDRIAQLIFIPFLVADNCNSEEERVGGIGSTGR